MPLIETIWTKHARKKLRYYRLSKRRVNRVLKIPDRIEQGIVPRTVALMQKAGTKKHPYEIWVMYKPVISKDSKQKPKLKVISTWKYPGRSPKGQPPVPQDITEELTGN